MYTVEYTVMFMPVVNHFFSKKEAEEFAARARAKFPGVEVVVKGGEDE